MKYVVAKPWKEIDPKLYADSDGLNIYSYHSEIQEGSAKAAKKFLEYVKFMQRDDGPKGWAIYEVTFTKKGP